MCTTLWVTFDLFFVVSRQFETQGLTGRTQAKVLLSIHDETKLNMAASVCMVYVLYVVFR